MLRRKLSGNGNDKIVGHEQGLQATKWTRTDVITSVNGSVAENNFMLTTHFWQQCVFLLQLVHDVADKARDDQINLSSQLTQRMVFVRC